MEVAANLPFHDHHHHHLHSAAAAAADDDYIDMEINSFSILANQNTREFEFHMSTPPVEKEYHSTTSPADELFYKGKLLPLHLPPRLQMVEKLLENSCGVGGARKDVFEEFYSTPLMATTPTAASTPYESCNISPAGSCPVSGVLNREEYLLEYSSCQVSGYIDMGESNPKRPSWAKKLKLIKQSALFGSKLKASRAYFKALFGKSGCSDDSCTAAAAARVADEGTISKASKEAGLEGYGKTVVVKKAPFGQIQNEFLSTTVSKHKSTTGEDCSGNRVHRRSFSMAIKRNSTAKSSISTSSSSSSSSSASSSSSSSLISSNGYRGLPFLKRSTSTVCSEIENPIQGAIAHCKQSQEIFEQRKSSVSEVGFYSLPGSEISISEEPERVGLCRG
ncbi:unnamed protein product [Linum trigynum]|uniref:Membrane-associated kinase regulator 4 n=1 Tax=Linum trigynum TaxID=586398 RepID=A0AAV2END1_9ROSI